MALFPEPSHTFTAKFSDQSIEPFLEGEELGTNEHLHFCVYLKIRFPIFSKQTTNH